MKSISLFLITVVLPVTVSCGDGNSSQNAELDGEEIVLARVNDSPITEYDLKDTLITKFKGFSSEALKPKDRQKMLKSLVQSRAIAQAREKELSPKELLALDKRVQAYREQLLVKQYLAKHAPTDTVTDEMVEKYYRDHPKKFGGKTTRDYEMISSSRSLATSERDKLLKAVKRLDGVDDWKSFAEQLRKIGFPMVYRSGQTKSNVLHAKLMSVLENLTKGKASPMVFIDGKAYVLRVLQETKIAPRPLGEVKEKIVASLKPIQMKKAVKKVSEQVLENTTVEYVSR